MELLTNYNLCELVQNVIDGEESSLKAYALLKEQMKYLDTCIKEIEPIALEESERFDEKQFSFKGFRFEKRTGARRFKFDHIQEWLDTKNKLKDIEKKSVTAYECKMKGINNITEDGEIIEVPIPQYSKDVLIVKQ